MPVPVLHTPSSQSLFKMSSLQPLPHSLSNHFLCIFYGYTMERFFQPLTFLLRFLNVPGFSTSDNLFSPATNLNIHSLLSLRYFSKLCTSTFTHSSRLISPLPPSFLKSKIFKVKSTYISSPMQTPIYSH